MKDSFQFFAVRRQGWHPLRQVPQGADKGVEHLDPLLLVGVIGQYIAVADQKVRGPAGVAPIGEALPEIT